MKSNKTIFVMIKYVNSQKQIKKTTLLITKLTTTAIAVMIMEIKAIAMLNQLKINTLQMQFLLLNRNIF